MTKNEEGICRALCLTVRDEICVQDEHGKQLEVRLNHKGIVDKVGEYEWLGDKFLKDGVYYHISGVCATYNLVKVLFSNNYKALFIS